MMRMFPHTFCPLLLVSFTTYHVIVSLGPVHTFHPSLRQQYHITRFLLPLDTHGSSNQLRRVKQNKKRSNELQQLWYREIDQDDDETDPSMFKVRTRLPKFGRWRPTVQSSSSSPLREQLQQPSKKDAINRGLIRALTLNQYIILGISAIITAALLALFSGDGFNAFYNLNNLLQWSDGTTDIFDFNVTPERLLKGVLSALPLLLLSNQIEQSDQRQFANINFSTITMCLTLFGRRSTPPDEFLPSMYKKENTNRDYPVSSTFEVAKQSIIMSLVTGFCEETAFRRFVPAMIALLLYGSTQSLQDSQSIAVPYLGQALLFGLGHIQPSNSASENIIQVGLQIINGLGFGLIYVLNDGDIVPCIIAHTTYDFIVFFKTWVDANDQIEYAERKAIDIMTSDNGQQQQQAMELIKQILIDPTKTNTNVTDVYKVLKRMFYLFDTDKNETLSLSEVRKGIAYMSIERQLGKPPPVEVIDQLFQQVGRQSSLSSGYLPEPQRLTFPDFVRLIALSKKSSIIQKT